MRNRVTGDKSAKRVSAGRATPKKAGKPRVKPAKPTKARRVTKGRPRGASVTGPLPAPYAAGGALPPMKLWAGQVHFIPLEPGRPSRAKSDRVPVEVSERGLPEIIHDPETRRLVDELNARRVRLADALAVGVLRAVAGRELTEALCEQIRGHVRRAFYIAEGYTSVYLQDIEKAKQAYKVKGPQDGQPEIDAEIFAAVRAVVAEGRSRLTEAFGIVAEDGDFGLTTSAIKNAYYRHEKRLV